MTASDTSRIDVLAAVIARADRYLVCKRPMTKRHGGLWEFPGGKIETGESTMQAASRELAEELGVDVLGVGETVFSTEDDGSPFVINFVPTEISGEPGCIEHAALQWAPLEAIRDLDLAPSDRRFVNFLLDNR